MRILAIDYGDRRSGLAFSDIGELLCAKAHTVKHYSDKELMDKLLNEIEENDVGKIVLGLPLNMDGSEGERAEKSRALGEALKEASGLEVVFIDERLTSVQAHSILQSCGKRERKHKNTVDAVAASLILNTYLDSRKPGTDSECF